MVRSNRRKKSRRVIFGIWGTVALFALWFGSTFVGVAYGASRWFVMCSGGSAVISVFPDPAAPSQLGWLAHPNPAAFPVWPERRTDRWGRMRVPGLVLPLWIPAVILAVATVFWWRRDRRHPSGHCQHCGYNLTGNQSGICPECGCATTT